MGVRIEITSSQHCNNITLVLMAISKTTRVSWYQNVNPSWILLQQEMMKVAVVTTGTLIMCKGPVISPHQRTNIQFCYRTDALPVAQPTLSKN